MKPLIMCFISGVFVSQTGCQASIDPSNVDGNARIEDSESEVEEPDCYIRFQQGDVGWEEVPVFSSDQPTFGGASACGSGGYGEIKFGMLADDFNTASARIQIPADTELTPGDDVPELMGGLWITQDHIIEWNADCIVEIHSVEAHDWGWNDLTITGAAYCDDLKAVDDETVPSDVELIGEVNFRLPMRSSPPE